MVAAAQLLLTRHEPAGHRDHHISVYAPALASDAAPTITFEPIFKEREAFEAIRKQQSGFIHLHGTSETDHEQKRRHLSYSIKPAYSGDATVRVG
jgi:hypothetical protein